PEQVETVVVAIPASSTPAVIEEAGQCGAKAAIVISSGFAEVGYRNLEEELVKAARKYDLRVIGPNCLGIYDAYTGMDTLFLPEHKFLSDGREVVATPRPRQGSISFLTQSGAFGAASLDYMAGYGMGIRGFVSYGNRCDVTEDELLGYFENDAKTNVILMYVEGLDKGRDFLSRAIETSKKKPIVALKAGKTEAGTRAAASHTAALAGMDQIYDGMFRQAGIIRARNVEELFDFGRALALQPPTYTRNVAVITNAGGPGIIAADALEESGLLVQKFPARLMAKFSEYKEKKLLLPVQSGANPIDLSAEATSEMFALAISTILEDQEIGGLVAITLHHAPTILDDAVDKIAKIIPKYGKPVTVCDMGATEMAQTMRMAFEKRGLPSYSAPERAARALWALSYYGNYLLEHNVVRLHVDASVHVSGTG
ncbi:MAG TPA: CoA-binding protein, partial [Candidatus Acidoferrales bacterium]|nr:CoA-binding protein [Candidatus Acidoferrales bacterium]